MPVRVQTDMSDLRDPDDRSVCDIKEHQGISVLLTSSRELAIDADAMSQSGEGMFAYAYPPTGLITEVLHKIERSQCEILLVAPCLPTQAWFPLLLSFADRSPAGDRPQRPVADAAGDGDIPPFAAVRLHVWKLSSSRSCRRAFRDRCRDIYPVSTADRQRRLTRPSGTYSFVGSKDGVSLHSLPL